MEGGQVQALDVFGDTVSHLPDCCSFIREEVLQRQGWCRGRGRGGGRVAVEAIGLRGTWGEDYMVPLLYSMGGRD